jgi:hypothetical protein
MLMLLLLVLRKLCEPNRSFTLKMYSDVRDGFVGHNHEHRNYTAYSVEWEDN